MHNIAKTAIARSISHHEIVTIDFAVTPYDSQIQADLIAACDDWTNANDDVLEFWGTDDNGAEWRVHLKGQDRVRRASRLTPAPCVREPHIRGAVAGTRHAEVVPGVPPWREWPKVVASVVVAYRGPTRSEMRRSLAPVPIYARRTLVLFPVPDGEVPRGIRRDRLETLTRALKRALDVEWTADANALMVRWSRGPSVRGGVCLLGAVVPS